ncbi:hypothetical protein HF521_001059, partial [Silurus meridionalis]
MAKKTARAKLSRAIREAKCAHAKKIHNHFQDSGDTRRMWQGIQAITNYKTTSPACDRDPSLPNSDQSPLIIDGSSVEIVKSTKFLGVHLADNLTWSLNTSSITKKAQQRLYFLRRLRKTHLPPPILTMFYRGTIESILSSCITAWFGNCTVSDRNTLQRIVRTAEKIIGVSLPSIMDIYTTRCIRKAHIIV